MREEQGDYHGLYIDGEVDDSAETFSVEDPSTGEIIATVAEAGESGVDNALESAKRAQSEWTAMDPAKRGRTLYRFAESIEEHAEELAETVTRENGRPIGQSNELISSAADYIEYYAGLAAKIEGQTIPVPDNQQAFTRKEPLGVSAQIIPWNSPVLLCCRGIGPALAAGNAVVVKPAPEAPLGLLRLGELASESGLPDGILNLVPGDGMTTGTALTTDPRVDEVTFTGSVSTGQIVGKAAIDNVVPMALELGGKSPAVVFEDADIDDAVEGAMKALTLMSGQVCFATTRIFVHEERYSEFRELLIDAVESILIGPGIEDSNLGPLISENALEKVEQNVDDAIENGVTALTGGQAIDRDGYFYEPTVIEGAADDDPISCEEVFGPVINLYEFSDEAEAIRRANDTKYGLYATVWTNDLGRAHRVANELEAGSVMVNQYSGSYPQTPFGGYKKSGLGREKGMQAIDHYTQLKTVNIEYGEAADSSLDE